jgi:hypothetical protein
MGVLVIVGGGVAVSGTGVDVTGPAVDGFPADNISVSELCSAVLETGSSPMGSRPHPVRMRSKTVLHNIKNRLFITLIVNVWHYGHNLA